MGASGLKASNYEKKISFLLFVFIGRVACKL